MMANVLFLVHLLAPVSIETTANGEIGWLLPWLNPRRVKTRMVARTRGRDKFARIVLFGRYLFQGCDSQRDAESLSLCLLPLALNVAC